VRATAAILLLGALLSGCAHRSTVTPAAEQDRSERLLRTWYDLPGERLLPSELVSLSAHHPNPQGAPLLAIDPPLGTGDGAHRLRWQGQEFPSESSVSYLLRHSDDSIEDLLPASLRRRLASAISEGLPVPVRIHGEVRSGKHWVPIPSGAEPPAGGRFRLRMNLAQPAYVVAVRRDEQGRVLLLHPRTEGALSSHGKPVLFPPGDLIVPDSLLPQEGWTAPATGSESFLLIASQRPLDSVAEVCQEAALALSDAPLRTKQRAFQTWEHGRPFATVGPNGFHLRPARGATVATFQLGPLR
jgi:hypothetical protein